ncbi:hypothetical protein Blut17040_03600 [Blautia luti]|nr:hypothetical protein Blut17040_03600 [Blautia luti]
MRKKCQENLAKMSKKLDNLDEIYANSIIMKNRKEVDEIVSRLYNYEPVKK